MRSERKSPPKQWYPSTGNASSARNAARHAAGKRRTDGPIGYAGAMIGTKRTDITPELYGARIALVRLDGFRTENLAIMQRQICLPRRDASCIMKATGGVPSFLSYDEEETA